MKGYTGKYNFSELEKNYFIPLRKERDDARLEQYKIRGDWQKFREEDEIAHNADGYAKLMIKTHHPELIETYEKYLEIDRLYDKYYSIVKQRTEETYDYYWDPEGTVGGAIAANKYIGEAVEKRDEYEKQRNQLEEIVGDIELNYINEYFKIRYSSQIYKHPEIEEEKRKAYKAAEKKSTDLIKNLKTKQFKHIKKFLDDNTLLGDLHENDFKDLLFTLTESLRDLKVSMFCEQYKNIEVEEINVEIDPHCIYYDVEEDDEDYTSDERNSAELWINIEAYGTYEDDEHYLYHIKVDKDKLINFRFDTFTVGKFTETFFNFVKECEEEFYHDNGEPFEREEYPNYPY